MILILILILIVAVVVVIVRISITITITVIMIINIVIIIMAWVHPNAEGSCTFPETQTAVPKIERMQMATAKRRQQDRKTWLGSMRLLRLPLDWYLLVNIL